MLEYMQIPQDGILLVHSAFKHLAMDGYDADQVLATLVDYMQPGTIVLPTMSWRFVNDQNPIFKQTETPCNTGILAEKFRVNYASHRSLHPTHSAAALGKQAEYLTNSHQQSVTPCDAQSPYRKMLKDKSYIIMLGVGIDCCTLIHSAEEAIAPKIYMKPSTESTIYTCIDAANSAQTFNLHKHAFLPRNYWLIQDLLATNNALRTFKCDNSVAIGFNANAAYDLCCTVLTSDNNALIAKPGQRYRMM